MRSKDARRTPQAGRRDAQDHPRIGRRRAGGHQRRARNLPRGMHPHPAPPPPFDTDKLHTLILLNMGAILDLPSPSWFGEFSLHLTIHVIDSTRPQNLATLFGGGDIGDRIVLWDDGEVENMDPQRKAWEALEVRLPTPRKPHAR